VERERAHVIMFALTYHGVGRMAPTLLALVICAYFAFRRRGEDSSFWLSAYFGFLAVFNLGYIIGYSLDHEAGGYAWFLACSISFAGAARLQFAYAFPVPQLSKERRVALVLSFALSVAALLEYALRVDMPFGFNFALHTYGSKYSSVWVPLVSFFCFAWSLVVSIRLAASLVAKDKKVSFASRLRNTWRQNGDFRGLVYLLGISIAELVVNGVYLMGFGRLISNTALASLMNVALLCIFGAYVLVYSTVPSGRTGFLSKLVGISLVAILSIVSVMGSVFQARDLNQLRGEQSALANFTARQFSQGEKPGSGVAFVLGPASSYVPSGSAADLRAALMSAKAARGFTFIESHGERYYIFPASHGLQEYVVGFPYSDFRSRLDSASRLVAKGLIFSAALVVLVFPLLFRASLVLPLRFLLEDLRRLGEGAPADTGDEIGTLRQSFRKMADLLKETRSQIPAFAPHLEEMESYASPEVGQIIVGSRTLVYRSRAMRRMIEQIERAREYKHAVLITGETGTGKELAARMVHSGESLPFVAVNCAALPETLWESEIFGHRKGAFTDAKADRKGRVVEAGEGTLFFDEIGEMPAVMQAKMLRLLQENQFTPLGSDVPCRASCRFVFATNRDLTKLVQKKQFREDLLYRIRVFHIQVPPLRERPEDIPDLVRFFVARFAEEPGTAVPEIDAAAMHGLVRYAWPGNIREVENAVVRAMAAGGPVLHTGHFAECQVQSGPVLASDGRIAFDEEVGRYSRALIEQALQMAEGNKTRAAGILGLKRTTLRYRMRDLGLEDAQD